MGSLGSRPQRGSRAIACDPGHESVLDGVALYSALTGQSSSVGVPMA